MRSPFPLLVLVLVAACHARAPSTAVPPVVPATVARPPHIDAIAPVARDGSAIAVGKVGSRRVLFVADEDEDAVHTLDPDGHTELARTELPGRPTRLLILPSGELAVSLRDGAAVAFLAIDEVDRPLRVVARVPTADEPIALAIGPEPAKSLWVASGWGRRLEEIDLEKRTVPTTIALGREPRALSLSGDGAYAFVGYMSEGAITVVNLTSERTGNIDVREGKTRVGRQMFAFVRMRVDGDEHMLAPYVMVEPGARESSLGYYGAGTSLNVYDVATIDVSNMLARVAPPKSAGTNGCGLPRAAVADPASDTFFVACLGNERVVRSDSVGWSTAAGTIEGGPAALAVDGARRQLFVLAAFDRSVSVVPIPKNEKEPLRRSDDPIELTHAPNRGLSLELSIGRRMFHNANDLRISDEGLSCASCHPDGRDDGLVWATPKGPRQTMFLAERLGRKGPYGWDAKDKTVINHVHSTTKNLRGLGLDGTSIKYLAAWLLAMPGPARAKRELDEQETLGRELFYSKLTMCGSCHLNGESDGLAYDVGSRTLGDKSSLFLAPSLRFVSGTAPYFHDGRYSSLFKLVQSCDGKMGSTRQLSVADMRALEMYLRTL